MNKILNVVEVRSICGTIYEDLCEKIRNMILKQITIDDFGKFSFEISLRDIRLMTEEKYSLSICKAWLLLIGNILSSDWEVTRFDDEKVKDHFRLRFVSK